MKHLRVVIAVIFSMALMIALMLTVTERVIFHLPSYQRAYVQYSIELETSMTMDDLMKTTRELLRYMRDERQDLIIPVTIQGEERPVFNEREQHHMVDVKELVLSGYTLRAISWIVMGVSLILLMFIAKRWLPRILTQGIKIAFGIMLGIAGIIGIVGIIDFSFLFTLFHQLLFSNQLWLLDPATDWMIRMFPEAFFASMALRIMIGTACCWVALWIISMIVGASVNRIENDRIGA